MPLPFSTYICKLIGSARILSLAIRAEKLKMNCAFKKISDKHYFPYYYIGLFKYVLITYYLF